MVTQNFCGGRYAHPFRIYKKTLQTLVLKLFLFIFCFIGSMQAISPAVFVAVYEDDDLSCKTCHLRLGLGGFSAPNKEISTKTYGGYLNADMGFGIGNTQTFRVDLEILLGLGKLDIDNTPYSFVSGDRAFMLEIHPSVGVNILSQNYPLYLSVGYRGEAYNIAKNKGYERALNSATLELNGALPTQSGFSIEYALGYDYLFAGSYKFGEVSGNSALNNGYTLRASLGFSHKLTENTLYYVRAIGKYHNLSTSKPLDSNGVNLSMPATQNYVGMVEIGIGF